MESSTEITSPLRVGILGAGKMAQNHAAAVARAGVPARVVAFADPFPAARDQMRAVAPDATGFDSAMAMLAEAELDAVHVVTPPDTHAELARRVLESGRHVYVEKPFAESSAQADAVLALAAARGLQVCAGHQLLFEPPARVASAMLPSLGQLHHIESYFAFRPVRRAPGGRTPLRADLQLLDILPHPVYVLLHFLEMAGPGATELRALTLGESGTVHALVGRGALTGSLVVTLQGRPVDSYLRLVGSNGSLHADFVRSTVQRHIGPGTSGIDKLVAPYRHARQLLGGTTVALGRRFLRRERSYPGLAELFTAFYQGIRAGVPAISPESILETTRIWERVREALDSAERERAKVRASVPVRAPTVLLTGGTGFIGSEIVRALLARGHGVRVLARRAPAPWEQIAGADYQVADLGRPLAPGLLDGIGAVVHAAAETAGGWEEHQRNSIDATANVIRAAAARGIRRVVHVSSLAVLEGGRVLRDDTPLARDSRAAGPYVWGKLESERLALQLGQELGVQVRVVRPGAVIDDRAFEPPGRLGKRLGNFFVAVGSPRHRLGVVDVRFTAETIAWIVDHFDAAPASLNLLAPELPTKRDLVRRLRVDNPDLSVVWLPTIALVPLSWGAIALQKALRPRRPAINVARVFAAQRYDTSGVAQLAARMAPDGGRVATQPSPA